MTAAELQMLAIAHPIAGIYAVALFVRCIVQMGRWQQQQQEDRHYADVRAWRDVAAEETQALKPVTVVRREPLAAWREAQPGETPGTVEPDDAPAPEWTVGTSEGRHHFRDQVEAAWHWHRPLHAAIGRRDPRIDALLTKTQKLFVQTLERAGEQPPTSFGPREPIFRRIEWTDETGWQQPQLDVEVG